MNTRPANSRTLDSYYSTKTAQQHFTYLCLLGLSVSGLGPGDSWRSEFGEERGRISEGLYEAQAWTRAAREKKTRLDATSAQCSQSASVYLLQKAAGWHFSLPGACVLDCAFVCGLKSTGNVCVFRVFAPVSLSLSRYSCRSDTQWRAAVPPHFNMAERPPHVYPREYSATLRLGGADI